ncbi:hypothetical protein HC248_01968 [Polaromonas vacuolata]|uniref:Uncharacterized protein n=1 Tax=Polaromonas vacuolata TaxID=37448 RepID=A0A6H2H9W3_9BURK|nr:hypothetical protein HC248_01968 [Polaromonas vacuolata]
MHQQQTDQRSRQQGFLFIWIFPEITLLEKNYFEISKLLM